MLCLANGKVCLDELKIDNAKSLFSLIDFNRAHLRKWLLWVDNCLKFEDSETFINASLEHNRKKEKWVLGIWVDSEIAGIISFHNIDWDKKQAEVGYWIGKKFEGKGYVTESCKLLLEFGFKELGLEIVTIICDSKNISSQKVPERLSFSKNVKDTGKISYVLQYQHWKDIQETKLKKEVLQDLTSIN